MRECSWLKHKTDLTCSSATQSRRCITVISDRGKEATITLLSAGEFIGEESIAGSAGLRLATATAITACTALRIDRAEMIRVMHEEYAFSDVFVKFLLARSMRTQADLVDQPFNSKRKAFSADSPVDGGVWEAR
jgi:CRP/FNR family transcriptional regulator, cyclic AMP receptor protein